MDQVNGSNTSDNQENLTLIATPALKMILLLDGAPSSASTARLSPATMAINSKCHHALTSRETSPSQSTEIESSGKENMEVQEKSMSLSQLPATADLTLLTILYSLPSIYYIWRLPLIAV